MNSISIFVRGALRRVRGRRRRCWRDRFSSPGFGARASILSVSRTQETGDKKEDRRKNPSSRRTTQGRHQDQRRRDPADKLQAAASSSRSIPRASPRRSRALRRRGDTTCRRRAKIALAETFRRTSTARAKPTSSMPRSSMPTRRQQPRRSLQLTAPWLTKDTNQVRSWSCSSTPDERRDPNSGSKFVNPSQAYAIKAIGIIEADAKPADLDGDLDELTRRPFCRNSTSRSASSR